MRRDLAILFGLVLLLRLPFVLTAPIQGDDAYYLLIAENARVDPLHPLDFSFRLQGQTVWAAGHTRPPLNGLVLAGFIEVFGGVDEARLHLIYAFWSLLAVGSMYFLARRFTNRPLWAALLFTAVPAFVISGNKLEADLPLLAFWTLGMAAFVHQRFVLAAIALALAGFTGYQAVLAVPILAHLAWYQHRRDPRAWLAVVAAPMLAAAWQIFERASTGTAPVEVLGGYTTEYGLLVLERKWRSSLALLGHLGWMVSPLAVLIAFGRRGAAMVAWALAAGLAATLPSDYVLAERLLYLISAGCGFLVLLESARLAWMEKEQDSGFLGAWVLVFFLGSLALFYAGSARYLLPLAPALVILALRSIGSRLLLGTTFAASLALGLAMSAQEIATASAYRGVAREFDETFDGRGWTNAEWGLRYYLGQVGVEPILADQEIPAGAALVESSLAAAIPYSVSGSKQELFEREIPQVSALPRTIGPGTNAGYSSSEFGVLPLGIRGDVWDRVTAYRVGVPEPTLSDLRLDDPQADAHLLSGFYPSDGAEWRWMRPTASAVLLAPENSRKFRLEFHIPEDAPARTVAIEIDGRTVAEQTYEATGGYVLEAPIEFLLDGVARITLRADAAYSPPGDDRELAIIVIRFGLAPPATPELP